MILKEELSFLFFLKQNFYNYVKRFVFVSLCFGISEDKQKIQFIMPSTPEQNGIAERVNLLKEYG